MLEDFFRFVASEPWYSAALALIPGLAGVIVGHRLTIERDKRLEYNAIADQVRAKLINMRGTVVPSVRGIPEDEWDTLLRRSSLIQAARLRRAMQRAQEAEDAGSKPDELGQALLADPPAMRDAREKIIALITHR